MANFRMDHRATFREGLPYPPSTLHSVEEFTEGALTLIEEVEEARDLAARHLAYSAPFIVGK